MEYTLFAIGLFLGALIVCFIRSLKKPDGTLKIDRSNPEKDQYLFVIDEDLEKLTKKKTLVLKVDPNADLSQK